MSERTGKLRTTSQPVILDLHEEALGGLAHAAVQAAHWLETGVRCAA
jgi:hypothetical protein